MWIKVGDSLPSTKNGYVDELVLVCMKNKNHDDGVYLYDVASFDGETWSERFNSYEIITHWMPIPELKED